MSQSYSSWRERNTYRRCLRRSAGRKPLALGQNFQNNIPEPHEHAVRTLSWKVSGAIVRLKQFYLLWGGRNVAAKNRIKNCPLQVAIDIQGRTYNVNVAEAVKIAAITCVRRVSKFGPNHIHHSHVTQKSSYNFSLFICMPGNLKLLFH